MFHSHNQVQYFFGSKHIDFNRIAQFFVKLNRCDHVEYDLCDLKQTKNQ